MDEEHVRKLMKDKYRKVYSERLDKYVYVMKHWVPKPVFKSYKQLFGYTDCGWTVKHPKTLIKILIDDGTWINPYEYEDIPDDI